MKTINIQINNAKIESFTVNLEDEVPTISATIGLYAGSKRITVYSLGTQSWQGIDQIDFRPELMAATIEIAKELEVVVTQHCQAALKQLGGGDT